MTNLSKQKTTPQGKIKYYIFNSGTFYENTYFASVFEHSGEQNKYNKSAFVVNREDLNLKFVNQRYTLMSLLGGRTGLNASYVAHFNTPEEVDYFMAKVEELGYNE